MIRVAAALVAPFLVFPVLLLLGNTAEPQTAPPIRLAQAATKIEQKPKEPQPTLVASAQTAPAEEPPAAPAKPVPIITGPSTAKEGDLIILDSSESVGADFTDWLVDTSNVAIPDDASHPAEASMAESLRRRGWTVVEPANGGPLLYAIRGEELMLSSYPGTYAVHMACSNPYGVSQLAWPVVVSTRDGTPTPQPPGPFPPPVDPPGPQPPDPTPQPPVDPPPLVPLGLTARAQVWYAAVPVESRKRSLAVGSALTVVGLQALTPGSTATVATMKENLAKALIAAIKKPDGTSDIGWREFFKSSDSAIVELEAAGKIHNARTYAQALFEIAIALAPGVQ